jgi:hypothetical protein
MDTSNLTHTSFATSGISSFFTFLFALATGGDGSPVAVLLSFLSSLAVGVIIFLLSVFCNWFVKPVALAYFYAFCDRRGIAYKKDSKKSDE